MTRGDVWLMDFGAVQGSEQAGMRPALVLQDDTLNTWLRTVVIVPFTTNLRWGRFPFCVAVNAGEGGLVSDSVALCHQVRVCDRARLQRRLGQLDPEALSKMEEALHVALGLSL